MIPNIRLMIVALLASIVAIGCGLGLFAAFRVNHDQFARVPNGSPLLQLAFVAPASVTDAAAAPIAVRLWMNTPVAGGIPTDVPAIKHDGAVAEPVKPIAAIEPISAPATPPSDNAPAITQSPAVARADTGQESPQAAGKDGIGDVAVASPADQSPPANPTAQDANPGSRAPSAAAMPAAKAAKKMTRYHAVRLRRRVQPQAATAAQPLNQFAAFPQPAIQSAAQATAPQTVRRRLVIKRRRLNKTAAATTATPRQTLVH